MDATRLSKCVSAIMGVSVVTLCASTSIAHPQTEMPVVFCDEKIPLTGDVSFVFPAPCTDSPRLAQLFHVPDPNTSYPSFSVLAPLFHMAADVGLSSSVPKPQKSLPFLLCHLEWDPSSDGSISPLWPCLSLGRGRPVGHSPVFQGTSHY